MERYIYEPLPPLLPEGQTPPYTRLVRIFPGQRDDPLRCTLFIVNIEEPPSYEALSYVWGPPSGTIDPHVLCDGRPVSITPNLDRAMRWLRYDDRERLFWIDAICIDQQNLDERGRQVGYMRSVYSYAAQSVVWLGPKTPGMAIAFEGAERMKALDKMPPNPTEADLPAIYAMMGMTEDQYDLATFYVSELFEVDYFSRIWCVQEIVASKVCIAKSEELEMNFLYLLELIPYIIESRGTMLTEKPLAFWTGMPVLRQHNLHNGGMDGSIGSILNTLSGTKDFKATDPKDKVFALLGISNEGLIPLSTIRAKVFDIPKGASWKVRLLKKAAKFADSRMPAGTSSVMLPRGLQVDYKKTVQEVYRDLTRYLIAMNPGYLDVLSHVQHIREPLDGDFPSWVPKWNEPKQASPLAIGKVFLAGLWEGNHARSVNVQDCFLYKKPKEANKLIIEGFKLDRIAKVTDVMLFDLHGPWPAEQIWNQLFDFPLFPHRDTDVMKLYSPGERFDMAFLLTATAAPFGTLQTLIDYRTMLLTNTGPTTNLSSRSAIWAKAKADAAAFILENTPMDTTALPHYAEINALAQNGKSADFQRQAKIFAHNRRFFYTSSGYLGIGPKVMQPGDEVCVLFGGKVPFILRPMQDHHLFVGDSYILNDDIMIGKRTEDIKAGRAPGTPVVMFELR